MSVLAGCASCAAAPVAASSARIVETLNARFVTRNGFVRLERTLCIVMSPPVICAPPVRQAPAAKSRNCASEHLIQASPKVSCAYAQNMKGHLK